MLEPNGAVALRDGETDSASPDEGAEDGAPKSNKEKKNDWATISTQTQKKFQYIEYIFLLL